MLAVALGWAFAGCTAEEPSSVRLTVTTDLEVEAELDEVRVTVIGSRSSEQDLLCEPVVRTFPETPGDGPLRLPLVVRVERGGVYDAWIAFRVEGRRGGATVLAREEKVDWADGGIREVTVALQRDCLGVDCAPEIEQCVRGRCAGVPRRFVFSDSTLRDPGMSCMEE